jgi:hypothetical protein
MTAAAGWTNKGFYRTLEAIFNGGTLPTNFYVALVTSAAAPTDATNTLGQLTEITAGNGYTAGGYSLTPDSTDFPGLTENDGAHKSYVQLKDIVWTAATGPIPSAGGGARYAVLTDDNGTVGNREVWAFWDLTSDRVVQDTETLKLHLCELDLYTAGTV